MQCMAARGDIVQLTSMAGYDAGEAYTAYPYRSAMDIRMVILSLTPTTPEIIGGLYGFVAFFAG